MPLGFCAKAVLEDIVIPGTVNINTMKSLTKHLWFETNERIEFKNITGNVSHLVKESKVKEGLVLVNAMHITASVYINDAESGLIYDYKNG